jgi:hypothetical protein
MLAVSCGVPLTVVLPVMAGQRKSRAGAAVRAMDTSNLSILVWLRIANPHDGPAAAMMLTF